VRAAQVAREAFPAVIEERAGGPPSLPQGQQIVGYPATNVARLALPGGRHGIVESTQPMAVETAPGRRAPIDLGLAAVGDMYGSRRPAIGVLIPRRLSDGIDLPERGVSLTPIDGRGAPIGGSEGTVQGASVLYLNTQRDIDTAVKPTTEGVEANTILRSVASPRQLYFRVGLPPGASLVQAHSAAGLVRIVQDGHTIAVVSPPSATDAAGTPVPVSMSAKGKSTLCANAECSPAGGNRENLAAYKLEATEPLTETYSLSASLWNTHVYVAQEKAPEVTFNYSSPTINGRTNVFYHGESGATSWLSPTQGTFEVKAHDPGIGVAWAQIAAGSLRVQVPIYEEGLGLIGKEYEVLKVDATPPRNLEVSGWPTSREISAAPHTLTVEATDGTAQAQSSGVKSISTSVDGGPQNTVPVVPCTLGPCTVSRKWTLSAEALTEGVHRLIVTATDNAANVASKEFTFDVRHGSPVSVGPGKVDPTTGQFKLSATDVTLAGSGGVSRVYQSRNLTAGIEGPLGPQWAVSLGGGEGLTVLPNGSVVLASRRSAPILSRRTMGTAHTRRHA
jgi:hypothetical protein